MVGKTLGHYEILEPLGKGGMGEVYRAHDPSLKRDIALKVLPEDFAADPDRLARLEREAHLLAALNHPNVATIHGLEEADGIRFLVLELVEGETLAERLRGGALEVEDALSIAQQIAEGLEAAHTNGIIHRDLKPANIKITPEGRVKVLDFGLAKPAEGDGADGLDTDALTHSPTLTVAGTAAGVLLGTAPYMSPEQAKGKLVDKRTDIWAFGCVLYEMLAGRRPFSGEDVAETIASILKVEPDWKLLPTTTPVTMQSLLRRCLRKDPDRRLHDIADARIEIEEALSEPAGGLPAIAEAVVRPPLGRRAIPWGMAGLMALVVAAIAALATFVTTRPPNPEPDPIQRLEIELPEGIYLPTGVGADLAISPDGESIVFVGQGADEKQLYLRPLGELEIVPIPGTQGAKQPFFSPDGEWVGFGQGVGMSKVSLDGFDHYPLCERCSLGTWGDDGNIYFSRDNAVWQIQEVGGGDPELVADQIIDERLTGVWRPVILPGSEAILFENGGVTGLLGFGGVGVLSLESKEVTWITDEGADPFYSPTTGHILFARGSALFAVPFDVDSLTVGQVEHVLQGVRVESAGALQAALSHTGTLAYAPASERVGTQLAWIDAQGNVDLISGERQRFTAPRLSPNGDRIAVVVNDAGRTNIWTLDTSSPALNPLTTTGGAYAPIWTPDGARVTFASRSSAPFAIQSALADGSGEPETLFESEHPIWPQAWHRDGNLLLYQESAATNDLLIFDAATGRHTPFLDGAYHEYSAALSHDGNTLAYVSEKGGSPKVYITPFPERGAETPVTAGDAAGPMWSPDDTRLIYRDLATADFATASVARNRATDHTEFLDGTQIWGNSARAHYDLHPDGERFLILYMGEGDEHRKIIVITNWFEELKERVPTGR